MSVSASNSSITNISTLTANDISGSTTCGGVRTRFRYAGDFWAYMDISHSGGGTSARLYSQGWSNGYGSREEMSYRFYTDSADSVGADLNANATAWSAVSDLMVKKDLRPLESDCCSIISDIDTTYFRYLTDNGTQEERVGVVAQSCPMSTVVTDPTTGQLSVKYTELIPYLIEANKELQVALAVEKARVDALETENSTQATQIADLLSRVTALEQA